MTKGQRLTGYLYSVSKILIIAVFIIIIVGAIYFEHRRGSDMGAVAGRLGLSFQPGQQQLPQALDQVGFDLFTQGPPYIKNRMQGERAGREITLFDFHYTATTSGEGQRTVPLSDDHNSMERRSQSVIWFRSHQALPDFDLSPSGIHRRTVGQRLGLSLVTLDGREGFNRRYTLLARDAERVRRLFTDRLLEFLAAHPNMVLESRGRDALFYRFEKLPDPQSIPRFLDDAEGLLALLQCDDC